jgi:hypothetical protein
MNGSRNNKPPMDIYSDQIRCSFCEIKRRQRTEKGLLKCLVPDWAMIKICFFMAINNWEDGGDLSNIWCSNTFAFALPNLGWHC